MGTSLMREAEHEPVGRHDDARRAAECTPGFGIAANPTTIGALLRGADSGTRERLAWILQRRHGNGAVERLLAPAGGRAVQRWAVKLAAGTKDCDTIVSYLDANSPYRTSSGWARTKPSFSWGGDPSYSEKNGVITASIKNPTVKKAVAVDMPEWSPTDPGVAKAWKSMYGTLRAHEARHEKIASEWEATLKSRLAGLSVTVADRAIATFNGAVQAKWDAWLKEHQNAHDAIDPYTAILDCATEESEEEAVAPEAEGETGATGEE